MRNKPFIEHMIPYVLFSTPFIVAAVLVYREPPKPPEPNPEDATFMMECVYGWDQTPENCRKILQGEDPPALPQYEQGC